MSLLILTCNCGGSGSVARQFLNKTGYEEWMTIPIYKGKDSSRKILETIPQYPEVKMLDNYLSNASKWVVILGWNENGCRWSDITHNPNKSRIEAKLVVETFS